MKRLNDSRSDRETRGFFGVNQLKNFMLSRVQFSTDVIKHQSAVR